MTKASQEAREAAAANILARLKFQHGGEQPWMDASTMSMRMGEQDDHWEVQAFAKFEDDVLERAACAADAVGLRLSDADNAGNDEAEEAWHGGCQHGARSAARSIRNLKGRP